MGRSDVAVTRRERSAGIPRRYRADRAGHQRSSASPRWRAIGQAPIDQFESTVKVVAVLGRWTVRKDAPASKPSSFTASVEPSSQKPRP